jgi:hypothetical protein
MRLLIVGGMLALAVSASLTPANATSGRGNVPCWLSEYSSRIVAGDGDYRSCACLAQCRGYAKRSPETGHYGVRIGYGQPSPDIPACVAKCVAAKKAAQR